MVASGSQAAMPPRNMRWVNSGKKRVAVSAATSRTERTIASI